ncbi:MAG: DUF192 domain-containing protein [Oligoflexia bacterium]|nr:DUF192 domain-containing protein [Oligoflexia bacterium]MBF0363975.1 DUF192 domain-containing protein [Oligoflexia bacterium]
MVKINNYTRLFILFLVMILCMGSDYYSNQNSKIKITLANKSVISVKVAKTPEEQSLGLSGVKEGDFGERDGLLFIFSKESRRRFWMPYTFFNLAIIFIDASKRVVKVYAAVPHYPKWPTMMDTTQVPATEEVLCQYVLEMKASSKLAATIKQGDILNFESSN